jgi:hypothetical protein
MKITKAQSELLTEMKNGAIAWTNEGANFAAWIGDETGKKIKGINRRTLEALVNMRLVQFIDGDYRYGLFKYIAKERTK